VGVRSDGTGEALNLGACQAGGLLLCRNVPGTSFNWHVLGQSVTFDGRLQNVQPDPGTTVLFDGFKFSGAAGLAQAELELFAKNRINIRDELGTITPILVRIVNREPEDDEGRGIQALLNF
jgi:hypothetical protein